MFKLISLIAILTPLAGLAQTITQDNITQGTAVADPSKYPFGEFVIDRIIYEERAYSTAQKTELGDSVELEMGIRYQKDENSFARFRFETDPAENRKDNETSNFEIIYNRKFKDFIFQVDLGLETDDSSNGGTNLGMDLDSDDTFISYKSSEKSEVTFYPFNFRTDVGYEFNTKDVTRISYIEGSPTTILSTPANDEEFVTKTIPGIEMKYKLTDSYVYAGVGIASYLYPTNSDFDIETNPSATSWERKEASAFKFGYVLDKKDDIRVSLQFAQHGNTEETGALLNSAVSFSYFQVNQALLFSLEVTQTTAGKKPYNLSRSTNWIEDIALNKPVYSDINGDEQDWVGESDTAYGIKLGYNLETTTPYISYKYQGEHFIFNDIESAHLLRTDDESKGHGGLTRVALGSFFYYDNLYFNPQLEWQQAKNPVFSNSTDVSNDRLQSSFKKENVILSLKVTFAYDGANLNQNWWF
ncbi:MAG: hypothetical protein ACJAS4_000381 [Bacteriovoracaceae bacterium]|jgi:hypothetical protein